ncbi:hypothetical protein [Maritalea sp.]|uniref:hypothetical protein n=1 Tax=Maritalea sp. TaxID=2003361 RepID=UPI003EF8D2DD
MEKQYSEHQIDHFLYLVNEVENAHELVCHLALDQPKGELEIAEKLIAVRDQTGAIWSMEQIETLLSESPIFYNAAIREARHPFLISAPSAISLMTSLPVVFTTGVFFKIDWGAWPKGWGDVKSHFAIEVFFKQRELQDRLDRAERQVKLAQAHLDKAMKDHPNDPEHRDVWDAKVAIDGAKKRKKELKREIEQLKNAMGKGDHKKAWKIVKANITDKLVKLRRELKGITGDTDKDKAERAKLNKDIARHEGEIYDAETEVEKLK